MGIELQIELTVFKTLLARNVQAKLRTTCFDPIGRVYLDHADVADAPIDAVAVSSAVNFRVPVDVYGVLRDAVLAAPNAVPAGATTPVSAIGQGGPVVLVLQLSIAGTVLTLTCIDVELGALQTPLGPAGAKAKSTIKNTIGTVGSVDLAASLGQLGAAAQSGPSTVELVDNVVSVRFGAQGPAAKHLFAVQEWGIFVDGKSVEQFAASQVPPIGGDALSLAITPHWRPAGTKPHVDIDYGGAVAVPDPFTAKADGTLACELSLTPTITKSLRMDVHWSLHVHLGDLVPGFVENFIEDKIAAAFDPASFGAIPAGDHAFAVERPLPPLTFGGAKLVYDSILASSKGMTLGGPVQLPTDVGRTVVEPKVTALGLPTRLEFCRELAKSGSGSPSKTVTITQVSTNGEIWLAECGAYCGIEVVSPGDWINPYINQPAAGTIGEQQDVTVSIPSSQALGITAPVQFIVRMARGVRLIDLGIPPAAEVDEQGHVVNAKLFYIPNCLYFSDHAQWGINWGKVTQEVVDIPPETPDWSTFLGIGHGLDVHLVTMKGLQAGELLQYRSFYHAIDVTADARGQAIVPVFLPQSTSIAAAQLRRVNRQRVAGHVSVSTASFTRRASLRDAQHHALSVHADRTLTLTTFYADREDVHEIGLLGYALRLLRRTPTKGHRELSSTQQFHERAKELAAGANGEVTRTFEEVELNPQPLPPEPPPEELGIKGIVSIFRVPGFERSPVAIATVERGDPLLLDLGATGTPRVAGTIRGPVGALQLAQGWAVGSARSASMLFEVRRS